MQTPDSFAAARAYHDGVTAALKAVEANPDRAKSVLLALEVEAHTAMWDAYKVATAAFGGRTEDPKGTYAVAYVAHQPES
ncbi:hypothetical protein [Hymenobacter koreensis]|uniref:Uncharacterized protein n=1 Tax=Hymenobacter koreensis TaxID=1084523 RepID=A0ABP8JN45_9BACT